MRTCSLFLTRAAGNYTSQTLGSRCAMVLGNQKEAHWQQEVRGKRRKLSIYLGGAPRKRHVT